MMFNINHQSDIQEYKSTSKFCQITAVVHIDDNDMIDVKEDKWLDWIIQNGIGTSKSLVSNPMVIVM